MAKEWIVQGNYGGIYGWEDENTEFTKQDGQRSLSEYRAAGPGTYRLISRESE